MSQTTIKGVNIQGIASAVPEHIRTVEDDARLFPDSDVLKISKSTGVLKRHVVTGSLSTSDLCFAAAERLLDESRVGRDSIDTLIFVSQTPDFILPATSCSLHGRLRLEKRCASFDVNLGCSGYIYGLWLASSLIACGSAKRVLLLVGDTITRIASPKDRSVALLFGDAGTATLLEKDDSAAPMSFVLGTDGSGQENLIVPAGGFRSPRTEKTGLSTEREGGNIRSDEDLYMNGPEIFTFTLKEVPGMIKSLVTDYDEVDAVVMHQANKFMLDFIAKNLKIPKDKLILTLENYGNTSSASIPLAMTVALAEKLKSTSLNLLLAGFGVGYSWGAVTLTCGPMIMPELVIVPDAAAMQPRQEE
jgi:3-oxoacyl-[acyl-carrier-protein] synthase-3